MWITQIKNGAPRASAWVNPSAVAAVTYVDDGCVQIVLLSGQRVLAMGTVGQTVARLQAETHPAPRRTGPREPKPLRRVTAATSTRSTMTDRAAERLLSTIDFESVARSEKSIYPAIPVEIDTDAIDPKIDPNPGGE